MGIIFLSFSVFLHHAQALLLYGKQNAIVSDMAQMSQESYTVQELSKVPKISQEVIVLLICDGVCCAGPSMREDTSREIKIAALEKWPIILACWFHQKGCHSHI